MILFDDFNETARWSNIAQFANTPLARLTIAAPFIAFLLFFNERLRSFLDLEELEKASGFWSHILDVRLEIFYFGLVFLGASIAIYSFTAPRVLKRDPTYPGYLQRKLKTKSDNAVSSSLTGSLRQIVEATNIPSVSIHDASCDSVPPKVIDTLHRLIENEFKKSHPADIRDENFPEDLNFLYSGTGYLLVDRVLEILINQRRVEWGLWKPMLDGSRLDEIDVFRLEYHLADYSSPKIRKTIFFLLVVSSIIVLIPTVVTIISALGKIFSFN